MYDVTWPMSEMKAKLALRVILPYWFDHLQEIFSYKKVQLPSAENVNETPG